jgi:hypothetical protein
VVVKNINERKRKHLLRKKINKCNKKPIVQVFTDPYLCARTVPSTEVEKGTEQMMSLLSCGLESQVTD